MYTRVLTKTALALLEAAYPTEENVVGSSLQVEVPVIAEIWD